MISINKHPFTQNHFPDGTLHVEALGHDFSIEGVMHFEWKYENDAELFTLICLRRHYSHYKATLKMSYLPHARMDRVKNPEDVFTLKYFCEVINSLNFDMVTVWDVHSNVSLGMLNNVYNHMPTFEIKKTIETIAEQTGESPVLFFPDEGAMKRYSDLFKMPYAFGIKKRDWQTGKIYGYDIVNSTALENHPVLIVDDICSYGSTFFHAADKIAHYTHDPIYLYVTHLEKNVVNGMMYKSGIITKIFTANPLDESILCDNIVKVG